GARPVQLLREYLPNIWRASDLGQAQRGSTIQIAGNVICRQRPGTAKGFVFVSLEDETGVSNAIVDPDMFERFRLVITEEAFLLIEGQVQNSDNVVLIKAQDIKPLVHLPAMQAGEKLLGGESHEFPSPGWGSKQRPYNIALFRRLLRWPRFNRHLLFRCNFVFRFRNPHQQVIKPADNVLQSLHAMPRLAGTGKLMGLVRKTHHHSRNSSEFQG